jgi:hypothetical protein
LKKSTKRRAFKDISKATKLSRDVPAITVQKSDYSNRQTSVDHLTQVAPGKTQGTINQAFRLGGIEKQRI